MDEKLSRELFEAGKEARFNGEEEEPPTYLTDDEADAWRNGYTYGRATSSP